MSEKVVEKPKAKPKGIFEQTLAGKMVTLFDNDFKPKISGRLEKCEVYSYVLDTSKFGRVSVLKHAVGVICETPTKAAAADDG